MVPTMGEIVMTGNGAMVGYKVRKRELRDEAWQGQEAKIH